MERLIAALTATYAVLLRAYPARFRREFGEEMRLAFRDGCRDAARLGGLHGLAAHVARTGLDLARTAPRERMAAMDARGTLVLTVAAMLGIGIGLVDRRATEVQGTLLALMIVGFVFGIALPQGAWRWGLAVGIGVPVVHIVACMVGPKPQPVTWGVIALVVTVIPAMIGTYAGVLTRTLIGAAGRA